MLLGCFGAVLALALVACLIALAISEPFAGVILAAFLVVLWLLVRHHEPEWMQPRPGQTGPQPRDRYPGLETRPTYHEPWDTTSLD